jgi:hypothetical protein
MIKRFMKVVIANGLPIVEGKTNIFIILLKTEF